MPEPSEILILKPSSLGDIVHVLPCAALLRKRWPESRICWLTNPEWAPLLEGNPHIDATLPFPRGDFRGLHGLGRAITWWKQLGKRPFDYVLDYQGLLRSGLIAVGARGRHGADHTIWGMDDSREGARWFHDRVVPVKHRPHAVDRYLEFTEAITGRPTGSAPLEWPLPDRPLPERFGLPADYVALHPFSRGVGKSLAIDQVVAFCKAMEPFPVVLIGRMPKLTLGDVPNLTNLLNQTNLVESISVIRKARWTVSVDSGPMHIAAALSDRVLSIHTWSDPLWVGPHRHGSLVWYRGQISRVHREAFHAQLEDVIPCGDVGVLAGYLRSRCTV